MRFSKRKGGEFNAGNRASNLRMQRWMGKGGLSGICDWTILLMMSVICLAGLLTLWSAGYDRDSEKSFAMLSQARSMVLGLFAFVFCNMINAQTWKKASIPLFVVGILLLLLIIIKGVVVMGARRWLDLGFFRMQPSEFTKLATIFILASYFSRDKFPKDGQGIFQMLLPLILIFLPTFLIARQPDLGTAMCHVLVGGTMLLLAGVRWRILITLAIFGLVSLFPIWQFGLKEYQKQRVLTFVSPELDPLGSGYHAIQSKIAVGSGALFGKGFMQGSQTQLRFLPEQTTDFIFSVFSEEWGFVGTIGVLTCYVLLIARLIEVASKANDRFSAYVCFGIAALIFWHVFVNMGMVTGVVPVVGITLPLFSFGGSSVLTVMAALGVASSVGRRRYYFSSENL